MTHVEFLCATQFDMLFKCWPLEIFCAVFGDFWKVWVGKFGIVYGDWWVATVYYKRLSHVSNYFVERYLLVLHLRIFVEFPVTSLTKHFAKYLAGILIYEVGIILFLWALSLCLNISLHKTREILLTITQAVCRWVAIEHIYQGYTKSPDRHRWWQWLSRLRDGIWCSLSL